MTTTTPLDLAEGRRLLSEATPAPWSLVPGVASTHGSVDYIYGVDADARLIVWLRNNAESLIAAAEDAERNAQGTRFAQIVGEELVRRGWMNNVAVTGPELLDLVLPAFDAVEEAEKLRELLGHIAAALNVPETPSPTGDMRSA